MTTPMLALGVAVAGGLGAALRYTADYVVNSRTKGDFPWGTVAVNVLGSLLMGVLVGAAMAAMPTGGADEAWVTILGTGLLGGFTTFSAASLETVRFIEEKRFGVAFGYGSGMLAGSILMAFIGWNLASILVS